MTKELDRILIEQGFKRTSDFMFDRFVFQSNCGDRIIVESTIHTNGKITRVAWRIDLRRAKTPEWAEFQMLAEDIALVPDAVQLARKALHSRI